MTTRKPTSAHRAAGSRSHLVEAAEVARAVEVFVVSPEEADHSVAEFWVGGEQFAQTLLRDGQVVLNIIPRRDRRPWSIAARDLHDALSRARALLGGS